MTISINSGARNFIQFDNGDPVSTPASGIKLYCQTDNLFALDNSGDSFQITISKSAPFILREPAFAFNNSTVLSLLGTGILLNETGTGNLSIATAGTDYYSPNNPIAFKKQSTNVLIMDASTSFPGSLSGNANYIFSNGPSSLTSAGNSVIVGFAAAPSATTTSSCIFIGSQSAISIVTGDDNVFIGAQTGAGVSNASQCIFIGRLASSATASGLSNSTAIGFSSSVDVNDAISLGAGCKVGINNSSPAYNLDIKTIGTVCGLCMDTSTLPANPAAGKLVLYHDGTNFKYVDSAGTVKTITAV